MPIHAPKILVFGGSEPLNVIGHHRDPQKAHPWPKPLLHANFGADRSTGATCARAEGIKKKERKKGEERNLQWQTGCSPRPPTLTQRYVVLHAGWSSGSSYKFQVSSKSVERISSCGGSKFAISYRPVAYITACTTVQAVMLGLLECNTVIWSPYKTGDISNIEKVQRGFTKRLPGLKNLSYKERLAATNLDTTPTPPH